MFRKEYIEKIRDLLLSPAEENVILGMQLVSKQFPAEMLQDFYALSLVYPSGRVYEKTRKIFKKNAPEEWWKFSIKKRIRRYDYNHIVEKKLNDFCAYKKVDKKIVGWYVLKKIKKGVKFCLENKVKTDEEILRETVTDDLLNLNSLKLSKLPKAVGKLNQVKRLLAANNLFTEIPDEIAQLKLEQIELDNTPLTPEAEQKIESFFPKVFTKKYTQKAGDFLSKMIRKQKADNKNMKKTLFYLEKATAFQINHSNLWGNWAVYWQYKEDFEKAIELGKKSINFPVEEIEIYQYTNLTHWLDALKKYEEVIELCEEGIKIFLPRKNNHAYEYSYLYSYKALALFHQGNYEKSIKVGKEAIKIYNENSMAHYNLSCAYAMLKDKEKMLASLRKSIEISAEYIEDAPKDKDFEAYWEDEDFKALLKELS